MSVSARQLRDPAEGLGSLALDFLHTRRRERTGWIDLIGTPQGVVAWIDHHAAPIMDAVGASVSVSEARILLDEAHRLRADIGGLVRGHHDGHIPEWALFGLNRMLATTSTAWRLDSSKNAATLTEVPVGSSTLARLGPIALAAARLVTEVPPDRLRPCASDRCGAWFVDTSKGGRRRWCSMARCGNREKAAVHRAKSTHR